MRIALLSTGIFPYEIGGIQKHSFYLVKYFGRNKIDVDVYCSGLKSGLDVAIEDYLEPEELEFINFINVDFPKVAPFPGHYVFASFLFSRKLYKEIKNNYDFIYGQGFTSWYFLRKNPFKKNFISNLHGLEMFQTSINIKNKFEHLILRVPAKEIIRKSHKQVSLGGKLGDILSENGAREGSVVEIPNGIDSSWIINPEKLKAKTEKSALNLIFIGRYERRKGIEEFQAVIEETIKRLDYKVDFIGPIAEGKRLKISNVKYWGAIKESEIIKKHLTKADILVCPSYSEGMPTVILEAMACGCAIIATDVGATATMVNKDNGWLLTGDIISGLKEALFEAVNTAPEQLQRKKINSIQKISDNFTWKKIIKKTIQEL